MAREDEISEMFLLDAAVRLTIIFIFRQTFILIDYRIVMTAGSNIKQLICYF